jgi:hypothetical protein
MKLPQRLPGWLTGHCSSRFRAATIVVCYARTIVHLFVFRLETRHPVSEIETLLKSGSAGSQTNVCLKLRRILSYLFKRTMTSNKSTAFSCRCEAWGWAMSTL